MHRICFIDDDRDFEIPLFERVFRDAYDVIAVDSFDAAQQRMAQRQAWQPDLFVLDLYFPSGEPDRDAVSELLRSEVAFEHDRAEIRAAYTNYLRAESRLKAVLNAYRQGPEGGLQIARRVVADYPQVPMVFYSRKATFEDAVRCLAAEGVWWLERKPTGDNDDDTGQRTLAARPRIVQRFNAIIARENEQQTLAIKQNATAVRQFVRFMLRENG